MPRGRHLHQRDRGEPPSPAAHASESGHDAALSSRERDHRICSNLGGSVVSTKPSTNCILCCVGASSTDHFPQERIENTLEPRDRVNHFPSFWSSKGQDDPDVPESLTYRPVLHGHGCGCWCLTRVRCPIRQIFLGHGR
uniref:Uncharacterized protein n=1 Tax=Arundo donax TaxID=35708 RepID=A0A0A9EZT9_ARUDO